MSKAKQKREILDPAVKGTVPRSVWTEKFHRIARVATTDLAPGDRVLIFVPATREKVPGSIVSVVGQGSNKRVWVDVIGGGKSAQREFRVVDCRITKIGRSGLQQAKLGFLKGGNAKPSDRVDHVLRVPRNGKQ